MVPLKQPILPASSSAPSSKLFIQVTWLQLLTSFTKPTTGISPCLRSSRSGRPERYYTPSSDERPEAAGLTALKLCKEAHCAPTPLPDLACSFVSNPEDSNTFAYKDVNYVDFYPGSDNPYLVMTGDDHMIKVWDDLCKSCLQKWKDTRPTVSKLRCSQPAQHHRRQRRRHRKDMEQQYLVPHRE
ncbi:hypothetical protein AZE42_13683 [Rhizopogon vesiculosus]|uniref:Uncharacterized protein n=1 Tax=Rhizopogon vesiculosus TaxID=180088 RepID=A0A1J8QWC1_9AGAM|nr:hypothetical protein AZE42_13683 [Rhizopogon vesiculosus]